MKYCILLHLFRVKHGFKSLKAKNPFVHIFTIIKEDQHAIKWRILIIKMLIFSSTQNSCFMGQYIYDVHKEIDNLIVGQVMVTIGTLGI